MKQVFRLPWPPSANHMWKKVRNRIICSPKYQEWKTLAGTELMLQRPKSHVGPVCITITLRPPHQGGWDLDNRIKPILDLLTTHLVIPDDNSNVVTKIVAQTGENIGAEIIVMGTANV